MSENHGKVWWSELMTDDPESAAKWWADVAGWSYDEMEMEGGPGPYRVAKHNDQPIAGIMGRPDGVPAEVPANWTTYIAVDDVDAEAKKAAQILNGPFDIPGVGRIAMVIDGGGAAVGLMTPAN
ncbi:MAG: VOC family protein [Pseudomonadota bacterium]